MYFTLIGSNSMFDHELEKDFGWWSFGNEICIY